MASWIWWVIWPGLVLGALTYFGYLGYDLFGKSMRVLKELEGTGKLAEGLIAASQNKAELPEFEGNLLDDPGLLAADHARNLKKREAKRLERQRRLINKLIDYDESEFKP